MNRILVFDTETGGLEPQKCGVCSVTLKVTGEDIIKTILIKPEENVRYDAKALEVNGFTLEELEEKGIPAIDAIKEINKFIAENFGYGVKPMAVGHNVKFDVDFLDALYERNTHQKFSKQINYHLMDTMMMAQMLHHAGIKKHSRFRLVDVYRELFGENFQNAHTSQADVLATERVYLKQIGILRGMKELALKNKNG